MNRKLRESFLTFDIEGPPKSEDFFDASSANSLERTLKILNRNELKGLFFITGTVAETLYKYPQLVKLLQEHEIGYHSTVHSIKPHIFEYTDIEDYQEAINRAETRETSSVDAKTGKISSKGGILLLREIFPDKVIDAFRAPFLCWSPAHFEALENLGFRFDFSLDALEEPFTHRGITFYPSPVAIERLIHFWTLGQPFKKRDLIEPRLFTYFLTEGVHVTLTHPSALHKAFSMQDDFRGSTNLLFFRLFIKYMGTLSRVKAVLVNSEPRVFGNSGVENVDIEKLCLMYMKRVARLFDYRPKYLGAHIREFFA